MKRQLHLLLLLACLTATVFAQKTAYIPNYLQDVGDVNGSQFTWSKTRQSANFTLIWGNTVGTNPANYPNPDLAFDPDAILDTMEYIYAEFKELGFLDDAVGTNLSQYKIPIVMYGTWGANGAQGFANGGDADGVIGAFWAHPTAMRDGGVAAHELTHSLQAQCVIDYRNDHGLGPVWNNAGIFWETHANFMRNLLYPKAVSAWGMDVYHTETFGDWKNTYENYELLLAIMESEGIDMVNRLWRESLSGEYPLQAYKRLAGYNQAQFNDSLFLYARRMATFDFNYNNIGQYFRQYRNDDLVNYLYSIQAVYSVLKKIPGTENRYESPIETAPEEFAYNVIPLYPDADSCAVIVKFKGHTEANTHAGWRYGFVAAHPNGTISRYSPTYADNTGEINFRLEGDENKLYLVVMGAPFDQITTNTSNDTWQGYPKHFRFPYELNISGAVPEGFQKNPASFRAQLKNGGHLHSNGGGWVQNSATVASSVYVGPYAMVLGNANLSGQVRLENTALVKNAVMSGQVRVLNNAFVNGGTYSGSAVIQGQGFAENVTMSNSALIGMRAKVSNYKLSGTVEVGGDVVVYNENGNCNNGVYYRLTNYYDNKLLECDGRTANHPVNKDVNSTYSAFSNEAMAPQCRCAYTGAPIAVDSVAVAPVTCSNDHAGSVQFHISGSCGPFRYAWGKGDESGENLSGLAAGNYQFSITDALGRQIEMPVTVPAAPALEAILSATGYDCASAAGGTAQVSVSSGTAPFSYAWDRGDTGATATNLPPGQHSVTATDAQGCSFSGSVQIEQFGQLQTSLSTTPIHCFNGADGSASLSALQGVAPFQWLWQNGQTDSLLANLSAGDYALTLTDALGCSGTAAFSLSAPSPLNLEPVSQPLNCFGETNGQASVTVSGGTAGYQYLWSNQAQTAAIDNLPAGNYTVTVTDLNGCSSTAEILVNSPAALSLEPVSQPLNCFGETNGQASVTVSGGTAGYEYLWNNQAQTAAIDNLPAGNYTVTVTDLNGCSSTAEILVNSPAALSLEPVSQPVYCFGETNGQASVMVSGGTAGYEYLWSNQAQTAAIDNIPAGNYSVTVTDANGCSSTADLVVGSPTAIVVSLNGPAFLCEGATGITIASASGGVGPYTYLWNDGTTGPELLSETGLFTVTVVDTLGCLQTQSIGIQVSEPITLSAVVQNATSSLSANGAILVTDVASGVAPYSFLWSNGATTPSLEQVLPGEYSLSITDAVGCLTVFQYNISFESAAWSPENPGFTAGIIPNPSIAAATLWLDLQEPGLLDIQVMNTYGQLLWSNTNDFSSGKGVVTLPQSYAAGIYWIRIQDESGKSRVLAWLVL